MGLFVVFEGPDGSGKTTQVARLVEGLRARGIPGIGTREPGGTILGDRLRELMLGEGAIPMQPLTWALLMNAARSELVKTIIRPALEAGMVVVADRYWYSTVAYQGWGEGLDSGTVRELSRIAADECQPDLVIYLNVSPAEGLDRKHGTGLNVLDRKPIAFHRRVNDAYRNMAAAEPTRWAVFDGLRPANELAEAILARVLQAREAPVEVPTA